MGWGWDVDGVETGIGLGWFEVAFLGWGHTEHTVPSVGLYLRQHGADLHTPPGALPIEHGGSHQQRCTVPRCLQSAERCPKVGAHL